MDNQIEYNKPLDIVKMFDEKEKVRDFFEFLLQNCERFYKNNDSDFLPFIYDNERESFSFSYDFFIRSMARFYDAGNKDIEEKIFEDFSISGTIEEHNKEILRQKNKQKAFLIVGLLQDYYGIIYPDNKKISSSYRGKVQYKTSYFLVNVYENKEGKAMEYNTVPSKKKNIIELGINQKLVGRLIDISNEKSIKQVAFNPVKAKIYWNENTNKSKVKFE